MTNNHIPEGNKRNRYVLNVMVPYPDMVFSGSSYLAHLLTLLKPPNNDVNLKMMQNWVIIDL